MPEKLKYIAITTSDGDVVKAEDPTYISPEYSENLRSRAEAEFGIDLSGMEFVSFSYLWNTNDGELPQEHEPLKTMLMDEVLVSHPGEGTPDGVYLDGEDTYMVRGVGNNQVRLVHCKIGGSDDWEQGQEDEEGRMFNGHNYTVVSVEISDTPMGEVGSVTYSEYEVVPGGVVGVEGHTDLPEYIEEPADGSVMLDSVVYPDYEIVPGGAVGVEGNRDLDGYMEERPVPIQLISGFEEHYSHDYRLIDETEFSLTRATPSAIYEGESKKDVVVSFEDNGPVTCAVTIVGGTNAGTYKCGFSGEGAIRIDLQGSSSYKVEYQLGVKANHGPPGYIDETVDASSGIIKVYEAK